MKVVIVESPAKCKSISTYLGKGYRCVATHGHVQKLVPDANIDVDNLKYEKIKSKQITVLKNEIAGADEVILATDNDREGETIAWHVCILFHLPIETTKRIIFHEITEQAIKHAISSPTTINMDIVHSQQARAVVDVLIGYNTTPILWKYLSDKDLSAGRCQTPALRLIWENQKKIDEHGISLLKYKVAGYFFSMNIIFDLNIIFETKEDAYGWLESLKNMKFSLKREISVKTYKPPDPLITSTLQQLASKTYNISPSDTMKYSQALYERGLITYMRTDCKKYSEDFLSLIEKYTGNKTLDLKTEGDCAHEAIRPTNINKREIEDLSAKEKKIYKLIWERTMQSCMADSQWSVVVCKLEGRPGEYFTGSAKHPIFLGWESLEKQKENKEYNFLLQLQEDVAYPFKKIMATPICSTGPDHICEAGLIKKLEEYGIGRPSTYASILEKIKSKKYAVCEHVPGIECVYDEYVATFSPFSLVTNNISKIIGNEKNKLIIQETGKHIMEVFEEQSLLDTLFHYKYTTNMENELDNIRDGNTSWKNMCRDTKKFITLVFGEGTTTTLKDLSEVTTTTLQEVTTTTGSTFIRDGNKIIGQHHGHTLVIQKGKFGTYASVDDMINISLFKFGNRPISNISFEEIKNEITKEKMETREVNVVRNISKNLSIRKGEWGNYIYYKTNTMKSPKFYKLNGFTEDCEICNLSLLQLWIKEKYKIN